MKMLDHALAAARRGLYVFPLLPDSKKPRVKFKAWATLDEGKIVEHWTQHPDDNIGIYTGRFGDNGALAVIDVDDKGKKRGSDELLRLELEGRDFPDTLTASTPSGGKHIYLSVANAVRQGVDVFGPGLDLRSRGGYVVCPGSTIGGKAYEWLRDTPIAPAPEWLVAARGGPVHGPDRRPDAPRIEVDQDRARSRAVQYLAHEAPVAVEGSAGDDTTFRVAARVKDFGVDRETCLALMLEHWNERCAPAWDDTDLTVKVNNAYGYGSAAPGAAAPEADFDPVEPVASDAEVPAAKDHPLEWINKEYAFCVVQGKVVILRENPNEVSPDDVQFYETAAFHQWNAAREWAPDGKKPVKMTQSWIEWTGRRSYDRIDFRPGGQVPKLTYNMWRGFAVDPTPRDVKPAPAAKDAVDTFVEHVHENICNGNDDHAKWVLGWLAHVVQKPGEKPRTALVLQGAKGIGKNIFIERMRDLLAGNFFLAAKRGALDDQFNDHLDRCLMLVLDEAFWSGDKKVEGVLKDLITGTQHVVERKYVPKYRVPNLTRVVIMGNDDRIAPASHDERRFGVFNVGSKRQNDEAFFGRIINSRNEMPAGGAEYLLRYMLDYDLTGINVNVAPKTKGLLEQKHQTLGPFQEWWLDCLTGGRIVTSDFGAGWPTEVDCDRFRDAFRRFAKDRGVHHSNMSDVAIGRYIRQYTPQMVRAPGGTVYKVPSLAAARAAWDAFIGHRVEWLD